MLYELDDLMDDFGAFQWVVAEEINVDIKEGIHHVGDSSVIRLVGFKN